MTSRYTVQPISKALRLLDVVIERPNDVSLSELVREVGLPKTTIFRYLQTLAQAGYLRHDTATDRYGIGPRILLLAGAAKSFDRLRRVARLEMEELAARFEQTVNLAMRSGTDLVYVEMVKPRDAPTMAARVGQHHPLHSTALGKAILAHLPPSERNMVVDAALETLTARTVQSSSSLRRQLDVARREGFALEREETEAGLSCIGCPVLDNSHYPIAAISLSTSDRRLMDRLDEYSRALKDTSCKISHLLF